MEQFVKWLATLVDSSLRPRTDELNQMLNNEDNKLAFSEFFANEDARRLFIFVCPPRQIFASLNPPRDSRGKQILFFKKNSGVKLTADNIDEEVLYADCGENVLLHLGATTREIYLPLLTGSDGGNVQSQTLSPARLIDTLHRIMAAVQMADGIQQGEVCLSLPTAEVLALAADSSQRSSVISILETTVVGWSKLIEKLLKHNPLAELTEEYGERPVPMDEVELWMMRRAKLVSVIRQLTSPVAVEVLGHLSAARSPYCESIRKIAKAIHKALETAEENLRYLKSASSLFEQLHVCTDPQSMIRVFPPLVHTVSLLWKHSKYYHQKATFHNLLFIISNSVVQRATSLIGSDVTNNLSEAYETIKEALKVCASFRGVYLDYREKVNKINVEYQQEIKRQMEERPLQPQEGSRSIYKTKLYGPLAYAPASTNQTGSNSNAVFDELKTDSPWPTRNDKVFDPLNSFMERCNDVLELVETVRHFSLLKVTADIGGAGNLTFDTLVRETHEKFCTALDTFRSSVPNVFDLDPDGPFMQAFFNFRTLIKSLEQRLAEVIRVGLSQCCHVADRLRLLQVFDGISSRHAVQAYLKEQLSLVVEMYSSEIDDVKYVFNAEKRFPPEQQNMPTVVSKLLWVNALRQRIKIPMSQLSAVCPHLLEGDRGWELRVQFNSTMSEIDEYETAVLTDWQKSVDPDVVSKLDQPLLVLASSYDDQLTDVSSTVDIDVRQLKFAVNLDDQLLQLIRELYYMGRAPLQDRVQLSQVLTPVMDQLQGIDVRRLQQMATQLETIVSMFNAVMSDKSMFAPLEQALFERTLSKISQLFRLGLTECTWRTAESADFIELATALVCADLHHNLDIVQTNRRMIEQITEEWCLSPLNVAAARDKSRSYSLHELDQMHCELSKKFEQMVVPAGHHIHKLVRQSFQAVDISEASPVWMNYLAFLDDLVLTGLCMTTVLSLRSLYDELTTIRKNGEEPLLSIRLELVQNDVVPNPPLDNTTITTSLQETVGRWIDNVLSRGQHMRTLSQTDSASYEEYVKLNDQVQYYVASINDVVEQTTKQCLEYIQQFDEYSSLWKPHLQAEFLSFLKGKGIDEETRRHVAEELNRSASKNSFRTASPTRSASVAGRRLKDEVEFLSMKRPPGVDACVPLLDDFQTQIEHYKAFQSDVMSLDSIYSSDSIGCWICIDLEPIKHLLSAIAGIWIWTFTRYIADQVDALLRKVDEFLTRTEPCIEEITGDERDIATFMKLMRIFNEVSGAQLKFEGKFPIMNEAVDMLKSYNHQLPDSVHGLLQSTLVRWNALKTRVSLAKQQLGPKIQKESAQILKDLGAFVERVTALQNQMFASDMYQRRCTAENAFITIKQFRSRIEAAEFEAQDLIQLQELLEASVIEYTLIPRCRHELDVVHQVWKTVSDIRTAQAALHDQLWLKLDAGHLSQLSAQHLAAIDSLPRETFVWDVLIGLHESVLIIEAHATLLDDLGNKAMRPRHWKHLMQTVGPSLSVDPETLKTLTFGELLKLHFHNHANDVHQIVQIAVAELSTEQHLRTYEEIWLSKVFELKPHCGTGAIHAREALHTDRPVDHAEASGMSAAAVQDRSSESHSSISQTQTRHRPGSRLSGQTNSVIGRISKGSMLSLPAWLTDITDDFSPLSVITNGQAILDDLENHQMALQVLQDGGTDNIGSFAEDISQWQTTLRQVEVIIRLWIAVQDKWIELEEVYHSLEMLKAAGDSDQFAQANHDYRRLIRATEKNNNVLQCCQRENIQQILDKVNTSFEICWKNLLALLEHHRKNFPRFYFLSNEDLLHIMCNSYDLSLANRYIGKLFENVDQLIYRRKSTGERTEIGSSKIVGIRSRLGEDLSFSQSVVCESRVDNWLSKLVSSIIASLKSQLAQELSQHDAGSTVSAENDGGEPSFQANEEKVHMDSHESADGQGEQTNEQTFHPVAEIAYLSTQIRFAADLTSVQFDLLNGNKDAFKPILEKIDRRLTGTVEKLKARSGVTGVGCHPYELAKLSSIISLHVNHRDLISYIESESKEASSMSPEFAVKSQLHYVYSTDSSDVSIECMGAMFQYGFEYLGSAERDVVTPTDRSVFHLLQAFHSEHSAVCISSQVRGGSTVQQICRLMGRALYSFCCTQFTCWSSLVNIFRGLVTAGATVCFQGVNNLSSQVFIMSLDVLRAVFAAFASAKATAELIGEQLKVDTSGLFVATVHNSVHSGPNSAFSSLPRQVGAQFRTVALQSPSLRFMAEVTLLSEGFANVVNIGRKLSSLFETGRVMFSIPNRDSVSSEQVRSVWSGATLKRCISDARSILNSKDQDTPADSTTVGDDVKLQQENEAILSALQTVIMSHTDGQTAKAVYRLVLDIWYGKVSGAGDASADNPARKFQRNTDDDEADMEVTPPLISSSVNERRSAMLLLKEFAPQLEPKPDEPDFVAAAGELGLLVTETFHSQVAHLALGMEHSQMVIITGPALCGKTSCLKTFLRSKEKLGEVMNFKSIFPGAYELQDLAGTYCSTSRTTSNGLLSRALREQCCLPTDVASALSKNILHIDGRVDQSRYQLMESLMHTDDVVVLQSNERLVKPKNFRLVWEVDNLDNASPSVISSATVINITGRDCWKSMLTAWLAKHPTTTTRDLQTLCDRYIAPTMCYLHDEDNKQAMTTTKTQNQSKLKRIVNQSNENIVHTFIVLMEGLLREVEDVTIQNIEQQFQFCCIWAFGSTLEVDARGTFSDWWKSKFGSYSPYPADKSIFECAFEAGQLVPWSESQFAKSHSIEDEFIYTPNGEHLLYLTRLLSHVSHQPVMLLGEPGCGKTAFAKEYLRAAVCEGGKTSDSDSFLYIHADRLTTSKTLHRRLDEKVHWSYGSAYLPKSNRRLVCVLDDLNMAKVDRETFNNQTLLELLRQHVTEGGFHCPTDEYQYRQLPAVDYVAIADKDTKSEWAASNNRLFQRFALLACHMPSTTELHRIFSTSLGHHFCRPDLSAILAAMNDCSNADNLRARLLSAATHEHTDEKKALLEHQVAVQNSLRDMLSLIVRITLEIHDKVRTMFLKTAARCHYLFAMKQLASLFRNLRLSLNNECTHDSLLLLWKHECQWTYRGRMVSEVDMRRYDQTFVHSVKKNISNAEQIQLLLLNKDEFVFSNIVDHSNGAVSVANSTAINRRATATPHGDNYQPTGDLDKLRTLLHRALTEHNKTEPALNLELYQPTVEHVCRLARTIASPPGELCHIYLVAEGGPSRAATMATLAASLATFEVFKLRSSLQCDAQDSDLYMSKVKADLVRLHLRAGVKGKKLLFLIEEDELVNDDTLVLLAEFVQSGVICDLFSSEQQISIINSIRSDVTQAGLTYTKETAWNYFLQTVRKNVRICFISSDAGIRFRQRYMHYGSFVRNVNICWLPHWPKQQLVSSALYQLRELSWMSRLDAENVAHLLATMHLVLKQFDRHKHKPHLIGHINNFTYEKFVQRFSSLADERYRGIQEVHGSTVELFDSISKQEMLADKMAADLERENVILQERTAGTLSMLSQIGQNTAIAEQQLKVIKAQAGKINKLKKSLPEYQLAHERAVYKTVAVVADTKKFIQHISLDALMALRTLPKPQADVEELLAAIIIILKGPQTDLTWSKGAKRQMANLERFIEKLVSFDEHSPPPESTLDLLESTYLSKSSLNPDHWKNASEASVPACESLCHWVKGVYRYHRLMLSRVKPLHALVEKTQQELTTAEQEMTSRNNKRVALEHRLAELARSFEEATVDKMQQQSRTLEIQKSLDITFELKRAMFQEKMRMRSVIDSLASRIAGISGASAMAAGFVTFLGPYDAPFRREMMTVHWINCLVERGIDLVIDSVHPVHGRVIEWMANLQFDRTLPSLTTEDGGPNNSFPADADRQDDAEADESYRGSDDNEEDLNLNEEEEHEANEENEDRQGERDIGSALSEDSAINNFNRAAINISHEQYKQYIRSLLKVLVGELATLQMTAEYESQQIAENAAILVSSSGQRASFIVDPHGCGLHVIQTALANNGKLAFGNLKLLNAMRRSTNDEFVFDIEKAIIAGSTLVIHGLGDVIDPLLLPLVEFCSSVDRASRGLDEPRLIKFNGRLLVCHPSFRLVLSADSLQQPQQQRSRCSISPLIASATTLIDFTLSNQSLAHIIIRRTLAHLKPEVIRQQQSRVSFVSRRKADLNEMSNDFRNKLMTLSSDDSGALDANEVSAILEKNQTIMEATVAAEGVQAVLDAINSFQIKLFPIGRRAATLFATVRSMERLCGNVHVTMAYLTNLFDAAFDSALPEGYSDSLSRSLNAYNSLTEASRNGDNTTGSTAQAGNNSPSLLSKDEEELLQLFPEDLRQSLLDAASDDNLLSRLTSIFYQRINLCLIPELRGIFSTVLCVNLSEEANACSDSEILWLLSDNLNTLTHKGLPQNSTARTVAEIPACPEWLSEDRWQRLASIASATRSSRLVELLGEISSCSDGSWKQWYQSDHQPSDDNLPMAFGSYGNDGSSLFSIHYLLLLRALRPDRFHAAAVAHSQNYLTAISAADEPANAAQKDFKRLAADVAGISCGFLVLLENPGNAQSQTVDFNALAVIRQLAESNGATLKSMSMMDRLLTDVQKWLDASFVIDSGNSWLVIERVDQMASEEMSCLMNHVRRILRSRGDSGCMLWLTSETAGQIPSTILQHFHPLSWDCLQSFVSPSLDEQENSVTRSTSVFIEALASGFDSISAETWGKFTDLTDGERFALFVTGVVVGVVTARRLYRSRMVSLPRSSVSSILPSIMELAVKNRSDDKDEQRRACSYAKVVFENCLTTEADSNYASRLLDRLMTSSRGGSSLTLNSVTVKLPPAHTELKIFGKWLRNEIHSVSANQLFSPDSEISEQTDLALSEAFAVNLEQAYAGQTKGICANSESCRKSMSHLRNVVDHLSQELATSLAFGTYGHYRSNGDRELCPVVYVLIQECHCLKTLLHRVQHDIGCLRAHLLDDWETLPTRLEPVAVSLTSDQVPVEWTSMQADSNSSSVPLRSWLDDLKKRRDFLSTWLTGYVKQSTFGKTVRSGTDNIGSIVLSLGSLFHPKAVLVAMRHQYALQQNCSVDELEFACSTNVGDDRGGNGTYFTLTDLQIEGAAWNAQLGKLTTSEFFRNPLPALKVKPMLRSEVVNQEQMFRCPLFTNSTLENYVESLYLPIEDGVNELVSSGSPVILCSGHGKSLAASKPKAYRRRRRKLAKPYFGDDEFEEDQRQLHGLPDRDVERTTPPTTAGEEELNGGQDRLKSSGDSQMSYQPFPARAPPLPPGLQITRESHIGNQTAAAATADAGQTGSRSSAASVRDDKPLQMADRSASRSRYEPSIEDNVDPENNVQMAAADPDETSKQQQPQKPQQISVIDRQPDVVPHSTMSIPVDDLQPDLDHDVNTGDEPSTLRFQSPSGGQAVNLIDSKERQSPAAEIDNGTSIAAARHDDDEEEESFTPQPPKDSDADNYAVVSGSSSQSPNLVHGGETSPIAEAGEREDSNRSHRETSVVRSRQDSETSDNSDEENDRGAERSELAQQRTEPETESDDSDDSDSDFLATSGSINQPTDSEDRVNLFK